ncbi:hypothetical protein, partial [Stenotrophomonas sp. SrG]|uniref:hypothetical protein n=1 Tax=Stenotrophomonas sp. SrG TaxID=3414430 RepID=UPI003CE9381E
VRPYNQGDQGQHRGNYLLCQPECGQLSINVLHHQNPIGDHRLRQQGSAATLGARGPVTMGGPQPVR